MYLFVYNSNCLKQFEWEMFFRFVSSQFWVNTLSKHVYQNICLYTHTHTHTHTHTLIQAIPYTHNKFWNTETLFLCGYHMNNGLILRLETC